jgi:hypothetical protein
MITLLRFGAYELVETKHHVKILTLGNETFAWIEPPHIGEILVVTHIPHKTDCILSQGEYRLYEVAAETDISNHIHLELEVGKGRWQGYLLWTGVPNQQKKRARIVPTTEVISGESDDRTENARRSLQIHNQGRVL